MECGSRLQSPMLERGDMGLDYDYILEEPDGGEMSFLLISASICEDSMKREVC
jgi:hypothetical protein